MVRNSLQFNESNFLMIINSFYFSGRIRVSFSVTVFDQVQRTGSLSLLEVVMTRMIWVILDQIWHSTLWFFRHDKRSTPSKSIVRFFKQFYFGQRLLDYYFFYIWADVKIQETLLEHFRLFQSGFRISIICRLLIGISSTKVLKCWDQSSFQIMCPF